MLVAALMVLLAVFGFVKIAEELGEGELAKLDEWLLMLLRVPGQPHVPSGPPWLVEVAQDITVLGGRTMLIAVTLFVTGYLALDSTPVTMDTWEEGPPPRSPPPRVAGGEP